MDFRREPGETGQAYADANRLLLSESLALCEHLLPGGRRQGNEYVCAGLEGGAGRSCSVNLDTGKWGDFEADDTGRDLIGLWAAVHGIQQHEAKEKALLWLSKRPKHATADKDDKLWWRSHPADKIWEYLDSAGRVVVQVKRWDARDGHGKVIRPWDPASQKYEWPNITNRPLFNLESIASGDGPVVVVGGEKCADAIADAGLVGTTVMGGESAIDRTDLTLLADRAVVVWADNDPAGNKWAGKMIAALIGAGAGSIHRVEVPAGKPQKWDAADATPDERAGLLKAALANAPVGGGIAAIRADEIAAGQPPERRWIVRGAIPRAVPAVLFGPGAAGKSLAVLDLCLKVAARGLYGAHVDPDTFLGPIPADAAGPAVFVTLEDDKAELHRRLHAIDAGNKRAEAPLFIVPGLDIEGFDPALIRSENRAAALTKLATVGLPRLLRKLTKQAGAAPVVLALDPAGDFLDGSEDDATIIKPLMRYSRELASKFDCSIIWIGHTAKGQGDAESVTTRGMRGSGAWTANARFAFGFWRPPYGQATRFLKDIGEQPTDANLARAVFGKTMKANHPGAPSGVRKYLQNSDSGLPEDMTARVRAEQATPESLRAQMLLGIKTMAAKGRPFVRSTNKDGGVYGRRHYLPHGPLNNDGDAMPWRDMDNIVKGLTEDGAVGVYSWSGGESRKPCYLDVPNGPIALNTAEKVVAEPDYPFAEYGED